MIKNIIDNKKNKWIVLIHPMGGTEKLFYEQIPVLSEKYNIVCIRLAGHTRESSVKDATFESAINEIHNFASEKNTKIDILGVSLGAMITTNYLEKYSEDVEKVYLISPVYGFSSKFLTLGYYVTNKIKKIIPRSLYMHLIVAFVLNNKEEKSFKKNFYEFTTRMDKSILYKWFDEITTFLKNKNKNIELLKKYDNVKLIYGEKDKLFLNFTKKYINGIKIIKNAGHLCNITNYEEFNKILNEK